MLYEGWSETKDTVHGMKFVPEVLNIDCGYITGMWHDG